MEQCLANPFCRFHGFDLLLSRQGRRPGGMRLAPNDAPRAVFVGEGFGA
jgi:hypothetical protein